MSMIEPPTRRHVWLRRGTLLFAGFCLLLATSRPLHAAANDLADAKRKAAAQLLKDGKPTEAAALIKEVIAANAGDYRDHVLLARAYEKSTRVDDAIAEWRKVQELLPSAGGDEEQRVARNDAEKRIHALDPGAAKLGAALEDVSRKLASLEHDPDLFKNPTTAERFLRLMVAIDNGQGEKDHVVVEVAAPINWNDTGVVVQAGYTYHIRAFGTWRCVANKAETECDAGGLKTVPADQFGPIGGLLGRMAGRDLFFPIGHDLMLTPRFSGPLQLGINYGDRTATSGKIRVYITRVK